MSHSVVIWGPIILHPYDCSADHPKRSRRSSSSGGPNRGTAVHPKPPAWGLRRRGVAGRASCRENVADIKSWNYESGRISIAYLLLPMSNLAVTTGLPCMVSICAISGHLSKGWASHPTIL